MALGVFLPMYHFRKALEKNIEYCKQNCIDALRKRMMIHANHCNT